MGQTYFSSWMCISHPNYVNANHTMFQDHSLQRFHTPVRENPGLKLSSWGHPMIMLGISGKNDLILGLCHYLSLSPAKVPQNGLRSTKRLRKHISNYFEIKNRPETVAIIPHSNTCADAIILGLGHWIQRTNSTGIDSVKRPFAKVLRREWGWCLNIVWNDQSLNFGLAEWSAQAHDVEISTIMSKFWPGVMEWQTLPCNSDQFAHEKEQIPPLCWDMA